MPADYSKVEAEITRGRYWRAKEILAGRLANSDYDVELFYRYAAVLQAMQDDDEAGRYFFLAGAAEGIEGELAQAFLTRRRSVPLRDLWWSMPSAVNRCHFDALPGPLISALRAAGKLRANETLASALRGEARQSRSSATERLSGKSAEFAMKLGCSVGAALFVLIIVLGCIELVRLLVPAVRKSFHLLP